MIPMLVTDIKEKNYSKAFASFTQLVYYKIIIFWIK